MRVDRFALGVFIALMLVSPMVLAKEPKRLTELKAEYRSLKVKDEPSRVRYVTKLTELMEQLHDEYTTQKYRGPKMPSLEPLKAVDAELRRHPMPATSDSKTFTQLRVGDWNSPRHGYRYRRDGTWTLLESIPDAAHGKWWIKGNQYVTTYSLEPRKENRYLIILLDRRHFVFADGEVVLFERRED